MKLVSLYKFLLKHTKTLLVATLCVSAFLCFFAKDLKIEASANSLLLEDDKDLAFFRETAKSYASDDFLMLAVKLKDENPLSPESLNLLKALQQDILQVVGIKSVLSILNAPLVKSAENSGLDELLKEVPSIEKGGVDLQKARVELMNSPFYSENIISKDGKSTAFVIFLENFIDYINEPQNALSADEKGIFWDLNGEKNSQNQAFLQEKNSQNKGDLQNSQNPTLQNAQNSQNLISQNAQISSIQSQNSQTLQDLTQTQQTQQTLEALEKARLNALRNIMSKYEQSTNGLYLGGISLIASDLIAYIKDDLRIYGLTLTLFLGLVLWFFFRKLALVGFTLLVCLLSLGAASGVFALCGFTITVISSNYLALMLIISISLVIHLMSYFITLCKKFPRANVRYKVLATLLAKSKPSFYAILTTAIGFLSLILSNIEPVIKLGIMMSVGICVSLVLTFALFASIMPLFSRIKFTDKPVLRVKFLDFCANFSLKYQRLIFIASLVIVLFSLFGIAKLRVENSFVNYFKDKSEIKRGLVVIDRDFGGTLPLEVIVRFGAENAFEDGENSSISSENLSENSQKIATDTKNSQEIHKNSQNFQPTQNDDFPNLDDFESEFDELKNSQKYWFDAQKVRVAKSIHEHLKSKEFVGSVLSLNSLLEMGKDALGRDLDDFTLALLHDNLPENFKQSVLNPYINIPKNELRFVMRIKDSDKNLQRNAFIQDLRSEVNELIKGENASARLGGIMLLYNNMLQSLFSSQFNTLAFVVITIFVLFIFVFRSVRYALVGILANLVPLSLAFAVMGFCKIPLDLMSITIAAICIGIGVDDSIHYIYNFKKELAKWAFADGFGAKNVDNALNLGRNLALKKPLNTKSLENSALKKPLSVKSLENADIKARKARKKPSKLAFAKAIKISHFYIGQAFFQSKIAIILGFSVMMSSNFIPTIYFGALTVLVMLLLLAGSLILMPALLAKR